MVLKLLLVLLSISKIVHLIETFTQMNLPAIFKFSNLSSILVYYRHLHEWKVLMERLGKLTKKLWENNIEAFIKVGENHNAPIVILYDQKKLNISFRILTTTTDLSNLLLVMMNNLPSLFIKLWITLGNYKLIKIILFRMKVVWYFEFNLAFWYLYMNIFFVLNFYKFERNITYD